MDSRKPAPGSILLTYPLALVDAVTALPQRAYDVKTYLNNGQG